MRLTRWFGAGDLAFAVMRECLNVWQFSERQSEYPNDRYLGGPDPGSARSDVTLRGSSLQEWPVRNRPIGSRFRDAYDTFAFGPLRVSQLLK